MTKQNISVTKLSCNNNCASHNFIQDRGSIETPGLIQAGRYADRQTGDPPPPADLPSFYNPDDPSFRPRTMQDYKFGYEDLYRPLTGPAALPPPSPPSSSPDTSTGPATSSQMQARPPSPPSPNDIPAGSMEESASIVHKGTRINKVHEITTDEKQHSFLKKSQTINKTLGQVSDAIQELLESEKWLDGSDILSKHKAWLEKEWPRLLDCFNSAYVYESDCEHDWKAIYGICCQSALCPRQGRKRAREKSRDHAHVHRVYNPTIVCNCQEQCRPGTRLHKKDRDGKEHWHHCVCGRSPKLLVLTIPVTGDLVQDIATGKRLKKYVYKKISDRFGITGIGRNDIPEGYWIDAMELGDSNNIHVNVLTYIPFLDKEILTRWQREATCTVPGCDHKCPKHGRYRCTDKECREQWKCNGSFFLRIDNVDSKGILETVKYICKPALENIKKKKDKDKWGREKREYIRTGPELTEFFKWQIHFCALMAGRPRVFRKGASEPKWLKTMQEISASRPGLVFEEKPERIEERLLCNHLPENISCPDCGTKGRFLFHVTIGRYRIFRNDIGPPGAGPATGPPGAGSAPGPRRMSDSQLKAPQWKRMLSKKIDT